MNDLFAFPVTNCSAFCLQCLQIIITWCIKIYQTNSIKFPKWQKMLTSVCWFRNFRSTRLYRWWKCCDDKNLLKEYRNRFHSIFKNLDWIEYIFHFLFIETTLLTHHTVYTENLLIGATYPEIFKLLNESRKMSLGQNYWVKVKLLHGCIVFISDKVSLRFLLSWVVTNSKNYFKIAFARFITLVKH